MTTVPAVKKRLVEVIAAKATKPTEVWRNPPTRKHQLGENIYIEGVKLKREWKLLGNRVAHQKEENYVVEVAIEVSKMGEQDDGTIAEERLWELVELVEDAIGEDVTLGGLENVVWALVEGVDQAAAPGTGGWEATATLDVAVKARV